MRQQGGEGAAVSAVLISTGIPLFPMFRGGIQDPQAHPSSALLTLLSSTHFCSECPDERFSVNSAQDHCSEGAAGAELTGFAPVPVHFPWNCCSCRWDTVQTASSRREGRAGTRMGHFPARQSCSPPFTQSGEMLNAQKIRGSSSNHAAHGCPSPALTMSTAAPGWSLMASFSTSTLVS